MIHFKTWANNDSEAWLEIAEPKDIDVHVTPLLESLAQAPLPAVSITDFNIGQLRNSHWVGAAMP